MKEYEEHSQVLLGVGNELRGDDGVGPYVAHQLDDSDWLSLNGATVPGNFTSVVKSASPNLLTVVDAAILGLEPGVFKQVQLSRVDSVMTTTHNLPLSLTLTQVQDFVDSIVVIGVQPKVITTKEGLSDEVERGAQRLVKTLHHEKVHQIEKYRDNPDPPPCN